MSAKKTTKKKASAKSTAKNVAAEKKAPAEANAKPKAPAKKDGKLSLLDASLKVLDAAGKPLHVREIVESVLAKGYWKAGEGKTPHQTLAASFLKEIKRGKEARVKKVGRGEFAKA